jgi:hypothetical protein
MVAGLGVSSAQVIGPGGVLIAPGPSQPDSTPGGIGPGGARGGRISPGPAGRDITIEQPGPGGIRIAPGPAGSIAAQQRPLPNNPVLYGSEPLQTTIVSGPDPRRHHRFRHRRPPGIESREQSRGAAALDYGPLRSICRGC